MRDCYDILQDRAASAPERIAFSYVRDTDGGAVESLTYGELLRCANAGAQRLLQHASPGDRVLLLYPNGLEFVAALFGCVAAGLVAVPAPVPVAGRERRALPRLRGMVDDADLRLVATDARTVD